MVGRAEGEAVTVGMPLLLPPSVLLYLRRLRGGARLPSEGGACEHEQDRYGLSTAVCVAARCYMCDDKLVGIIIMIIITTGLCKAAALLRD
jgi:hypothetical protein